jgi:hypothetical protein
VRLEASTKPHVHNLIHEFLINMAFTMDWPNFKKGLKMVSGPLGVKEAFQSIQKETFERALIDQHPTELGATTNKLLAW